jgi:hypothetical protein
MPFCSGECGVMNSRDKVCVIAIRVHTIGNLGVLLVYSVEGDEPQLKSMWNPARSQVTLPLKDFE